MAVGDAYVFPGFLTAVLTQLFFPKPPTTFLTCFCRGERRKYAGKKSRLNQGSNSQPPGHESDMLTTEPKMVPVSLCCTTKKETKNYPPLHKKKAQKCCLIVENEFFCCPFKCLRIEKKSLFCEISPIFNPLPHNSAF